MIMNKLKTHSLSLGDPKNNIRIIIKLKDSSMIFFLIIK
jgi:hypothetical protein